MAIPTTRTTFKEYCLRALGAGVVQINVSDDQVEDRIDEAIYLFQQFHMDAVQLDYLKHQITASIIRFTPAITGTFRDAEPIVGHTSGVSGTAVHQTNANTLSFFTYTGMFTEGEVVEGKQSGALGTVATSNSSFAAITLGDMNNGWLPIDDAVIGITKVFPPYDGRTSSDVLFDPTSQFTISLMSNFTNNSIVPYVVGRSYQQLLSDTFRGRPLLRYQRHQNRLYLDVNFSATFYPGDYVIIECYRVLDPNTYPEVWSDRWLQRYTIALIKRQWSYPLTKYKGITLPGGVTVDGKTMYDEAVIELKELQEELETTYQEPPKFLVG